MTYKEIINRFRTITENHLMLEDFGYGDLSDLKYVSQLGSDEERVGYPYLYLLPSSSTRNGVVMNYSFNMIVMDMARPEDGANTDEYDNYITIQSQCQQYIDDVLANLYYFYKDQPEIELTGITYTPFKEKYQDVVAGMTATITIAVPTPLNECIAPFPYYELDASVTTNIDRTLGGDPLEDDVFTYEVKIYDPNNNWDINRYNGDVPGTYKFVMNQAITLNQPAPGEALPTQPVVNQLTDGADQLIPATTASGWPTEFVNTTTVYTFSATWIVEVPDRRPGGYVWEFVSIRDQLGTEESTLQQLAGGELKISRLT